MVFWRRSWVWEVEGRFKTRFAVASYCAKVSSSFFRVFVASVSFAWVGVLFGSLEEVVVSGTRLERR